MFLFLIYITFLPLDPAEWHTGIPLKFLEYHVMHALCVMWGLNDF